MKIKEWLYQQESENIFLVKDVADHGCSGGVGGLIYYRETVKFHDDHEEEIWDMLYTQATDEGLKVMDLIARVAKDAGSITQLKNQLVWYAVEVRAQEILAERSAA
jgi:hypothetical protein